MTKYPKQILKFRYNYSRIDLQNDICCGIVMLRL